MRRSPAGLQDAHGVCWFSSTHRLDCWSLQILVFSCSLLGDLKDFGKPTFYHFSTIILIITELPQTDMLLQFVTISSSPTMNNLMMSLGRKTAERCYKNSLLQEFCWENLPHSLTGFWDNIIISNYSFIFYEQLPFFSLGQQWKQDKEALIVNGKLLVAMGLPWTLEILQGFHHHFDDKNNNSNFANFLFVLNNINAFMVIVTSSAIGRKIEILSVFLSL